MLLPFIEEMTTTLSYQLPTLDKKNSEDKQKLDKKAEDLEKFLNIINTWAVSAFKEEKANIPGFLKVQQHIRHMQTANTEINRSVTKLMNVHYHMVYRGLKSTTFNWFTSPKGNNTQAMQTHFVKSLLEESKLHHMIRKALLQQVPELYDFRNQLLATIKNIVGLEKFTLWSQFTEPSETAQAVTYDDKLVSENFKKMQYEEYSHQVDKAFQTLINTLGKPGLLGVQIGEDPENNTPAYMLHGGLQNLLARTYEVSMVYFT